MRVVEDLTRRTAREVLDDHLNLANDWVQADLARVLAEELPEREAFRYTYVAVDGRMGLLEWGYEDSTVLVRDGVDSYLIEGGKIVAQTTIHYTLEVK